MSMPPELWGIFETADGEPKFDVYDCRFEAQEDPAAVAGKVIYRYVADGSVPKDWAKRESDWNERLEALEQKYANAIDVIRSLRGAVDACVSELEEEIDFS